MGQPLPGFETPAVGFDQPYAMLHACHERVQRTLALLQRLLDYIQTHGHDAQSRSAATDVLRYFDQAAPQHHEDEERHVFPLLLAHGDATMRTAVQQLQSEHTVMADLWMQIRPSLLRWRESEDASCHTLPDETLRTAVARWCALYAQHIQREEDAAFPAAQALMNEAALRHMGADMQARRRQNSLQTSAVRPEKP